MSAVKKQGKCKWWNDEKGYGFILCEDGKDVFCHYKAIEGNGYKGLTENQKVEFEEFLSETHGPEASKVWRIT